MAALSDRYPSESSMQPDLDRIRRLLDLLGSPQRAYPSVHLTGTNGKTSTARMVDSLLRANGLRTGRFTSPHLDSPTERICIEGQPLSDERFGEVYDEIAPYLELVDDPVRMTFFEVLTGMAFAAFADAPVDVAVVEVGLGGLWDATNVVEAPVAVVLPVGLDHMGFLGSTLAEIATEKAGIIHPGATVVLAAQPPEAASVLLAHAASVGATIAREGLEFGVVDRSVAVGGQLLTLQGLHGRYDEVFLPLHGPYQASNAAAALAAVEAFLGRPLDGAVVQEGFAAASSPGRLEVVRTSPTVVVDAAHNPAGMAATVAALDDAFAFTSLIGVIACLADKDARAMLEVLEPALTAVVVTENGSPRHLPVDALHELAVDVFGADRVSAADRLDDALDVAIRLADEAGSYGGAGVLVTGSVVTAGEARRLLSPR
ncbi:MAG: folylpolyglutamate synthase/dihydrofolate synthase family protein [Mycobacteriales bacterium]